MSEPVDYIRTEIESYLPSGWTLAADLGTWDDRKGRWSTLLRDSAEMEWELAVGADAAAKTGRIEALRLAMDKLYRERLGRRTRGMGL
jgi:hypothetical protein